MKLVRGPQSTSNTYDISSIVERPEHLWAFLISPEDMNRTHALDLLGLKGSPTDEEIKKAYRKMAMKYHPDRVSEDEKVDAEEKFKKVKEAFEFLERKEEDPIGPEFWKDYNYFHANDGYAEFLKKMRESHSETMRAQHYSVGVKITLKEAFNGCTKKVDLTTISGSIETIQIPPGLKPDEKIKTISGKNGQGNYQIDLFIDIDVEDATVVWPEYLYLHGGAKEGSGTITQPILVDWLTIMTGGFKTVYTLDGTTGTVRIPAGIEAGKMLKIANKGYWSDAKQSRRGDLLLKVTPIIPKISDVTEEQVKQFVELTKDKQNGQAT